MAARTPPVGQHAWTERTGPTKKVPAGHPKCSRCGLVKYHAGWRKLASGGVAPIIDWRMGRANGPSVGTGPRGDSMPHCTGGAP